LSRMNCQMFSTGLSSGDFGGNGKSVMAWVTFRDLPAKNCKRKTGAARED